MDNERRDLDEIARARQRISQDLAQIHDRLDVKSRARRALRYRLRYPRAIATVLGREIARRPRAAAIAGTIGIAAIVAALVARARA